MTTKTAVKSAPKPASKAAPRKPAVKKPPAQAAAAAVPPVVGQAVAAKKKTVVKAAPKAAKLSKAKAPRALPTAAATATTPAKTPAKTPTRTKPKLVRDSFTMPKAEYAVIDELKQRAAKLGQPAKKSELLRAGVKALNAMNDAMLRAALRAVPTIKTGRPHKG
ncbi:MAG: hypothetical protein H7306_18845 [Bacteriovorax sp.]|nr:hypothetical protein [Rhizobacter sp.]